MERVERDGDPSSVLTKRDSLIAPHTDNDDQKQSPMRLLSPVENECL